MEHVSGGATRTFAESAPAPRRAPDPPRWVIAGILAGYAVAALAMVFAPGGTLMERLRALDGGVCAQLPAHSFFPDNDQLPLCARCTGIYVGFAATLLYLYFSGRIRSARLPRPRVAVLLGLAALAMVIDGFNSLFRDLLLPHLYEPQNALRLATGLGMGTAMAAFLVPVANGLLWKDEEDRASFASLGQFIPHVPVLTVAFVAIASQAAFLLYPIAIFESCGLLLALGLVNLILTLGITGRVAIFTQWRQLLPFFTVALVLSVVELMALFVLKQYAMNVLSA